MRECGTVGPSELGPNGLVPATIAAFGLEPVSYCGQVDLVAPDMLLGTATLG